MHTLAVSLEVTGLALLIIEAMERRAARWKLELEEADARMQDLIEAALERTGIGGRGSWGWLMPFQRLFLLLAIWFASVVARFDQWKDRHRLSDLFFLLALACAASGVAISVAFS